MPKLINNTNANISYVEGFIWDAINNANGVLPEELADLFTLTKTNATTFVLNFA